MGKLINFEKPVSKRLRKKWNVPRKIKYRHIYDKGEGQREYLVEIKPEMNDFGSRYNEKIYATITLTQIFERTYVNFFGWRPKVISRKIFYDKFLLNKGRLEFDTFKKDFVSLSGLENDLIEDLFNKEINKLINFDNPYYAEEE